MDVHLPGINGTTATAEIRKFDKETPIVALTAISLNENREMLLSFGMNEVITKPFNPDKFYEVIAVTIELRILILYNQIFNQITHFWLCSFGGFQYFFVRNGINTFFVTHIGNYGNSKGFQFHCVGLR